MGGTWVDYNLQTTIPGLFLENQTSQIKNRLGASALMQGLADGYFVPYTIGDYLSPDIKNGTYIY
jgi:succinate dehydrogenase / fumarate reductase flavoprotein subunit